MIGSSVSVPRHWRICNNSGGSLVSGAAYTELALFARLTEQGELELVNHLGIELGETPRRYWATSTRVGLIWSCNPRRWPGSDPEYIERVREINEPTPSRFNATSAGFMRRAAARAKLAVFAVRVDTFDKPKAEQVFYVGTNAPEQLNEIRRRCFWGTVPRWG
ncbi:MAG: hypothetical protein CM15mP74_36940 [Halieaceae bacterium]|nr:MAG: hypothetical protein CM15mP74_36940 [Halieaceae bacterium]